MAFGVGTVPSKNNSDSAGLQHKIHHFTVVCQVTYMGARFKKADALFFPIRRRIPQFP